MTEDGEQLDGHTGPDQNGTPQDEGGGKAKTQQSYAVKHLHLRFHVNVIGHILFSKNLPYYNIYSSRLWCV